MRARTVAAAALAAASLAGLVLWLLPDPPAVEVAPLSRGPIREVVEGTGRTRVRERYLVTSPVSGHLERPTVSEGQRIEAGAVLAQVAPAAAGPIDARSRAELSARLAAARAAGAEAEARLARARIAEEEAAAELGRAEALAAAGAAAGRDLELARFARRARGEERAMAGSEVRRAAAEVEAVGALLASGSAGGRGERVQLRAPAGGVVLRVVRESEGPVAAGTPVVELGDLASLEVEVDLLTSQAVRVRPGGEVVLGGWGGAEPLGGRVRRVDPSAFTKVSALGVEEQRVHVVVDPAPTPGAWSALGDGYSVEAALVVAERAEALKAPAGALFRDGDGWAAFALEGGRARLRRLVIGERSHAEVAILGGLPEGALLILHPTDKVRDGLRVVAHPASAL